MAIGKAIGRGARSQSAAIAIVVAAMRLVKDSRTGRSHRMYWKRDLYLPQTALVRYGFAALSIAFATAVAFTLVSFELRDAVMPAFVLVIGIVTWYAGTGPAALAVMLSAAAFNYFFVEPYYTFYVSARDLPYLCAFVLSAVMVASFSAVRRRVEDNLRHARDRLEVELEQRRQREAEIRKLNQDISRHAAELDASNRELEAFAYSVSHDLRAPLRHVVGYSELLQRHASAALDEKGRRYIRTIIESGERMGNLIDNLLSFSRIGRTESRMTVLDLRQLIEEAVSELKQIADHREICWKIGVLPVCCGDRTLIKSVIVNLLSNAIKFSRKRCPAKIEIGSLDKDAATVEVFIKDNGVGFDMQYAGKLFGVFQRLHRADEFEGTGIGLATVQRIVQRHGGDVRAEGVLDQGATFYFSLPKARPSEARGTT